MFEFWIHECNIYMYKCTAVDLFCPPRSHFLFVENKYPGIALQLQRSRGIPSTPATYLLELEKKRVLRLTHSKSRYADGDANIITDERLEHTKLTDLTQFHMYLPWGNAVWHSILI